MADEYTPTTDEVADAWASRFDGEHTGATGDERRGYEAEFYRWLAAHDVEVAAKAREDMALAAILVLSRAGGSVTLSRAEQVAFERGYVERTEDLATGALTLRWVAQP